MELARVQGHMHHALRVFIVERQQGRSRLSLLDLRSNSGAPQRTTSVACRYRSSLSTHLIGWI